MFLIVILLFTIVDYCSGGIEDFKKGLAAQPSPRSFFVVFKTWQTIEIVKILMIRCKKFQLAWIPWLVSYHVIVVAAPRVCHLQVQHH